MIYIKEGCEEAFACHPPVELRQADPQVSVSYIVVGAEVGGEVAGLGPSCP